MTNKGLYVSLELNEYKSSSSLILNTQIALLSSIKKLYEIQKLRNKKNKLKQKMAKMIQSLDDSLEKIDKKLPESPKSKLINQEKSEPVRLRPRRMIITEEDKKMASVDEELMEIQEKLKKLNG